MKNAADTGRDLYFLSGEGEMAKLTRKFDWSKTALGEPSSWPSSLQTTIGIVLHSGFPMFLFWGEELTCFYNDAFLPSLGVNGKHPALGKTGKQIWPEIWDFIGPLIDKVMTNGEAVVFHDQLVPFERNGRLEDIYWTFSYSPVFDPKGKIEGVLVVCTETTATILNRKALEASEERIRNVVADAPFPIGVYTGEEMIIEVANPSMLKAWGKGENVIGKSYKDILPELASQEIFEQIESVYRTGISFHAKNQRVDIVVDNKLQPYYFNYSFTPLADSSGRIYGVMNTGADVTDLNLAKLAIHKSEENLRNTILQAPVAMCIFKGPDHIVELANDRMFELWGRPATDILHQPIFTALPEVRDQGFEAILKNVYITGETFSAQGVPVTLPRGGAIEDIFINFVYEAYRETDGSVSGVLAVALDVTDQVIARKKIAEAEEKARLAITSADLGVYEILYATNEMHTDKRFKEIWGFEGEASREQYASVIHQDDLLLRAKAHKLSLKTGHLDYMPRVIWSDGSVHWLRITGRVLFDEKNNPLKLIGVAQDVTDAIMTQKKVEESEENMRNMILQAPVAMCIMTGPLHIVEVANESMLALWGKEEETVIYKPIFEGLPDAKEQGLEALLDHVYSTGETFKANERPVVLLRNGRKETVFQNFTYQPYSDASGTVLGVLAVSIDVTEQVLARQKIEEIVMARTQELAHANKDLQKSNAELAQFAYIASHDLQEPLRKISTFTQMLGHRVGNTLDELSRNYLDKIHNSSARMHTLIRDVLTYSELVKESEGFEKTDLNKIAGEVLSDYELLIEEKKAVVQVDALPQIEAIPLQMSQLFGNIIGNALKFARKDIPPVIRISAMAPTAEEKKNPALDASLEYIKIRFSDNGIGFKKEHAEQIFNIFQRLHRKSEYEGTGIGLAMCKKIALNHHGDLDASGTSENGAVFNVLLPVKHP